MMRALLVGGFLLVASSVAHAQHGDLARSAGRSVFVIDANRQEWQGRLLKVSADALEVESDAGIRTFQLSDIRRVDADGDSIWNGAAKGALIGAGLGLFYVAYAGPAVVGTSAFWSGLLGLAIDAGCSTRHPVYHGAAMPAREKPTTDARGMQVAVKLRW